MRMMVNKRQISLQIFFLLIINAYTSNVSPTIDPVETILTSNDSIGEFLCNGHRSIKEQPLELKIENEITAPPKFQLKVEQFNSTTIKVLIIPNGFVGRNRIFCFWKNQPTRGGLHDLTVGARPGRIQLKERCQVFDRQYVQCTFSLPTVARAYQNGFDRDYSFSPLNRLGDAFYIEKQEKLQFHENKEMIFRFETTNRRLFDREMSMMLTMKIGKFGMDTYNFSIDPVHTTHVDYSFGTKSKNQIILLVNHSNENLDEKRICDGRADEFDAKKNSTFIRTIFPTSDLKIIIDHLRSATTYNICLRCYYDENDLSFKNEICQITQTLPDELIVTSWFYYLIASLLLLILIGSGLYVYWKWKDHRKQSSSRTMSGVSESNRPSEPPSPQHSVEESDPYWIYKLTESFDSKHKEYKPLGNGDVIFEEQRLITPDTIDLRSETDCPC